MLQRKANVPASCGSLLSDRCEKRYAIPFLTVHALPVAFASMIGCLHHSKLSLAVLLTALLLMTAIKGNTMPCRAHTSQALPAAFAIVTGCRHQGMLHLALRCILTAISLKHSLLMPAAADVQGSAEALILWLTCSPLARPLAQPLAHPLLDPSLTPC